MKYLIKRVDGKKNAFLGEEFDSYEDANAQIKEKYKDLLQSKEGVKNLDFYQI